MTEIPEADRPRTTDSFLGGRLFLRQTASGHRCGTDAVLLAAAAPARFAGLALDVGAGAGAAGLALAVTRPGARVGLVDIDSLACSLARENIRQNGLSDRCFAAEADLLSPASRRDAGLGEECAGLVVTNPPFFDPSQVKLSPDPGRQRAHAMPGKFALCAWVAASVALVAPGGLLIMIHRADALSEILQSLQGRAGGVTLLPIHPRDRRKAVRILVRAKKGSRAPLAIAPPLLLHDSKGFTSMAEAIHRGETVIEW